VSAGNGAHPLPFWVGINGTRKDVFRALMPSEQDMARYAYIHGPFSSRERAQFVADHTQVIAESFKKKG